MCVLCATVRYFGDRFCCEIKFYTRITIFIGLFNKEACLFVKDFKESFNVKNTVLNKQSFFNAYDIRGNISSSIYR